MLRLNDYFCKDMILVIDDDLAIRTSLSLVLKRAGYEVKTVATPAEAIDVVRTVAPQLVLMDMNFTLSTDGVEGLTLLKQVKIFQPHVPVMLMTAWGSIDLAVEGIKAGAVDFVTKPWDNRVLLQRIETAIQLSGNVNVDSESDFDRCGIIGNSESLLNVLETVKRIASTEASVLITGESGTGKELIAEAIHRNSRRASRPFVKVNLGGISHSLFESEMFGHKKGSFTGAVNDRAGRFELADKGSIFLDEIGDLDKNCQVKLLRVLQDRTYEVLGDSCQRRTDVRVICATNADLRTMVADGSFREDLFYRINLITLHLAPLRERAEDIPLLVNHFMAEICAFNGIKPIKVDEAAMNYLKGLPFSGNIRELKNLVERTVLVYSDNIRLSADEFRSQYHADSVSLSAGTQSLSGLTLDEMERQAILQAITQYEGNMSQVAMALGISRGALYRRLEKYGITQ